MESNKKTDTTSSTDGSSKPTMGGSLAKKRKSKYNLSMSPNESEEAYKKRRQAEYRLAHTQKQKAELAKAKSDTLQAMTVAMDTSKGKHEDVFLDMVVGRENFDATPPESKWKKCSNSIAKRMNISEILLRRDHVESKAAKQTIVSTGELKIGFHVDWMNVGDKSSFKKKANLWNLPVMPWLHIKKSGIVDAGHGCYADVDFKEGAVIGLYMGGERGHKDYRLRTPWDGGKVITCYSLTNKDSLEERSAKTMGMQMCNDPTLHLKEGETAPFKVNAEIKSDLFVVALSDIKKGEEIFVKYNWSVKESGEESSTGDEGDKRGQIEGNKDGSEEDDSNDSKKSDPDHEEEVH